MVNIERAIKDIGRLKKYRKDELLFSAQQKADGLYYVQSGEIRVFKMDEQGVWLGISREIQCRA